MNKSPETAAQSSVVVHLATRALRETPENWTIYRKTDINDKTFQDLVNSIAEVGIKSPLEISEDLYIISGHRRYKAAMQAGLSTVPCITAAGVVMEELSDSERVALLAEPNIGTRIKTASELYLEAAAGVDPEEAVRKAQRRKSNIFAKAKKSGMTEVEITGSISRTDPSGERREMLAAVLAILAEKRDAGYLPTSGRHIHYSLLQKNVRTSPRSNGFIYGKGGGRFNKKTGKLIVDGSAGLLSKLLTDARSACSIEHGDIDDETRPSETYNPSGTVGHYINEKLDGLFTNYFSDVHAEQPNYVEILVEKNTVFPLLVKHVADLFRVPITSQHGYGSFPSARDISKRFKRSGKDRLVVIYVSDLDPEGINMAASWKKYVAHDFGVEATVYRAAVTPEQVKKYNLPPDADVKLTSTRAPRFVEEYGEKCWELDSMPEEVLIDEVSTAVRAVLDIPAFNRAMEREKEADIKLAQLQASVRAFVNAAIGKEEA